MACAAVVCMLLWLLAQTDANKVTLAPGLSILVSEWGNMSWCTRISSLEQQPAVLVTL